MEKQNVSLVELKGIYDTSEKMAREIRMLSRAFKAIEKGGLKEETIVVLLHFKTKIAQRDIWSLLSALKNLESDYARPERKI
jgi:hypothetical protein